MIYMSCCHMQLGQHFGIKTINVIRHEEQRQELMQMGCVFHSVHWRFCLLNHAHCISHVNSPICPAA